MRFFKSLVAACAATIIIIATPVMAADQGARDMIETSKNWKAVPVVEWAKTNQADENNGLGPIIQTSTQAPVSTGGFGVDTENGLFIVPGQEPHEISHVKVCDKPITPDSWGPGWVQAGPECQRVFVVKSWDYDMCPPEKRMAFLISHGDPVDQDEPGMLKDSFDRYPTRFASKFGGCTIAISRLRPGHFDRNHNYSSGSARVQGPKPGKRDYQDNNSRYSVNVNGASTQELRRVYQFSKIMRYGKSSGGNAELLETALHPNGTIALYGYAPSCMFHKWRDSNRDSTKASLDPSQYLDRIPKTVKILLAGGGRDRQVKPRFVKGCVTKGRDLGLDISYLEYPDLGHKFNNNEISSTINELMPDIEALVAAAR